MRVLILGMGYVGLSIAALLSKKNKVAVYDLDRKKTDLLKKNICPISDKDLEIFFKSNQNTLKILSDDTDAYSFDFDFAIVATPTNYDEEKNNFDTSSVENVIKKISENKTNSSIIIKSTIPIGFVDQMQKKFNNKNIIFSPEFLREGNALRDNLYPSRIIVGSSSKEAKKFANIMLEATKNKDAKIFYTNSKEAESIKLFANTYLALRVSFFNELDSFCMENCLNSKDIIDGVSADNRVGNFYNNPSFGYGGYCLPKDTKQLLSNYKQIPQNLINAIVESNQTRKDFIVDKIIAHKPKLIGIYRLLMKKDSDNFRSSAIQGIISRLNKKNIDMIIYEPNFDGDNYEGIPLENSLNKFKQNSSLILANRISDEISDIKNKVFTRDIYNKDI